MDGYQEGYSNINPAVLDKPSRMQKALKIQRVFTDFQRDILTCGVILDIGCSGGIILSQLNISNSGLIGLDIDANALKKAHCDQECKEINFICADGMHLPFKEKNIDMIICNHVYEHLPDSGKLFTEIFRTLKSGGVCYCSAGNALSIMEGHYHLPFLSWLPKPLAHKYLKITHRGEYYYEKHLNWWQLKKQIQIFVIHDYTIRIIREPELFGGTDLIKPGEIVTRIPILVLKLLYPFIPTWILILEKTISDET